jgi:hypothetical protein
MGTESSRLSNFKYTLFALILPTPRNARSWCSLKSTELADKLGLWNTKGMKKPHLELIAGTGKVPLWGHCSSCPGVRFYPTTNGAGRIQQEGELRAAFDRHFIQVHLREHAAQTAAGIVREATDG